MRVPWCRLWSRPCLDTAAGMRDQPGQQRVQPRPALPTARLSYGCSRSWAWPAVHSKISFRLQHPWRTLLLFHSCLNPAQRSCSVWMIQRCCPASWEVLCLCLLFLGFFISFIYFVLLLQGFLGISSNLFCLPPGSGGLVWNELVLPRVTGMFAVPSGWEGWQGMERGRSLSHSRCVHFP